MRGGHVVLAMFVSLQGCWKSAPEPASARKPATATPVPALPPASATAEIEGEDAAGVPFALSDYRGKVVLLTFWADW